MNHRDRRSLERQSQGRKAISMSFNDTARESLVREPAVGVVQSVCGLKERCRILELLRVGQPGPGPAQRVGCRWPSTASPRAATEPNP